MKLNSNKSSNQINFQYYFESIVETNERDMYAIHSKFMCHFIFCVQHPHPKLCVLVLYFNLYESLSIMNIWKMEMTIFILCAYCVHWMNRTNFLVKEIKRTKISNLIACFCFFTDKFEVSFWSIFRTILVFFFLTFRTEESLP